MKIMVAILILYLIALLIELAKRNRNDDGCFRKSPYNCLNCKKECKWHDEAEKLTKI